MTVASTMMVILKKERDRFIIHFGRKTNRICQGSECGMQLNSWWCHVVTGYTEGKAEWN